MSLSAHFPVGSASPEPEYGAALRLSTSLLSASGSIPILAALFVEEAVEAVCLSLSQSLPIVAASVAAVDAEVLAEAPLEHVNPRKPLDSDLSVVAPAADADAVAEAEGVVWDDYAYDGLDEDAFDAWDYEEDAHDFEALERDAFGPHARKLERITFKAHAAVPLRAKQENKEERISPNKRVGHRLVAKMARSLANKRDNANAHKHGRPPAVYWQPDERRVKSQEERDLEEALRRSRREGRAVPAALSVNVLLDLQNRELTPEDYELLLLLDETVEKKKVSKDTFSSYPQTILEADLHHDCPVCMSPMAKGEKITTLPCSHQYHTPCIEQWLTMSSPNCPLDGLSLLHDH